MMADTLLSSLVGDVRATSDVFSPQTPDDSVVQVILSALRHLSLKGLNLRVVGTDPTTWAIATPDISDLMHPVRAIIALQAKILALKSIPLKRLKITGLDQEFNTEQAKEDEAALDEMLTSYVLNEEGHPLTMTEYDVLGNPGILFRTIDPVLFPTANPLIQ
jgi:hypothetical protein